MTEEKPNREYLIVGDKEEQLNVVDKLLQYVQLLSKVDANKKIELYIDGSKTNLEIFKKENDEFYRIDEIELDDNIGDGLIKMKNEDNHYFSLG